MSGLERKYLITKADGSAVDKNFYGFVLRLDEDGDKDYVNASIKALRTFAYTIRKTHPKLADDLLELVTASEANNGRGLPCGED